MNPVILILGIIVCNYDKTFDEIYLAMQVGFKDTVFEELPRDMVAQSVIKLLIDGMIEMSGEVNFEGKSVEEVVNMLLNNELSDRKFRLTKKK
jgi:hypothetical protein